MTVPDLTPAFPDVAQAITPGRVLGCAQETAGVRCSSRMPWRIDTARLERAFPLLGPLTDARWVSGRDNDDRSVPSPELVISDLARLTPGKPAEPAAARAFLSEGRANDFSSWFEKPLQGEGPQNPEWLRSHELDRAGSGHATNPWFDRRSGTVRFWALNPYG